MKHKNFLSRVISHKEERSNGRRNAASNFLDTIYSPRKRARSSGVIPTNIRAESRLLFHGYPAVLSNIAESVHPLINGSVRFLRLRSHSLVPFCNRDRVSVSPFCTATSKGRARFNFHLFAPRERESGGDGDGENEGLQRAESGLMARILFPPASAETQRDRSCLFDTA